MTDIMTPLLLSLIAGASTGIGGLIGITKRLTMRSFDTIIGFAAGVMLAVATLGLIEESYSLIVSTQLVGIIALIIIGGVAAGVLVLLFLDKILPHIHALSDDEHCEMTEEQLFCERECMCPDKDKWFKCPYLKDGKCTAHEGCFCPRRLKYQKKIAYSGLLLAIGLTLHNAPEGIAVGVGFLAAPTLGFTMALAIAIHNIPEGLAISVPLMQGNYSRKKSLLISSLSGMSEPIACLIAILFLQFVHPLFLAFFLAFAGGAMIYVTSDELIPESHKHGYEHEATIGLLLGFMLMLALIISFGV
ncbi:MAG: hypothetical protein EAX96_19610 [Candidatus Lokiarchaeota archaeon]|nr:hypothetical protein [Candidatus Lokiarchaeota archaeon]